MVDVIQFGAFVDEMSKIAEDKPRINKDQAREAARQAIAAGAGTAAGIAGADLLGHIAAKKLPSVEPIFRSKAVRYGVPALTAAGSLYASHRYKKNVNEMIDKARGNDEQ